MADLADLIQKLSFYQAGGKDPGTDDLDKVDKAFGIIDKTVKDVLAIKKSKLEGQKTIQETEKLKQGNRPVADVLGEGLLHGTQTLVPGTLETYDAGMANAREGMTKLQGKFGGMNFDQYKDMAQANKWDTPNAPNDERPASSIITYDSAKTILKDLTPEKFATMRVGEFNALVGASKQTDLNTNRGQIREESRDRMVLQLRQQMETNPTLNRIREQRLGLDTSDVLSDLVAKGNTVGAAALGLKQAKGLGEVGVMTESDVTRYVTSGMLTQRAGDILSRWLTGTPTDATLQEIAEINNVLRTKLVEKINFEFGTYVDLLANNFDIPREEAVRRLAIKFLDAPTNASTASGNTDQDVMQSIQGQLPPGAKIKSIRKVQ